MKKFLSISMFGLIAIALMAFTGPTDEIMRWCDSNIHQERVDSDRAGYLVQKLQQSYRFDGEEGVDAVLDKSDSSWYSGLDLYMGSTSYSIIQAMNNDLNATWRDTSIEKATVEVAYDGRTYLVLVISYR